MITVLAFSSTERRILVSASDLDDSSSVWVASPLTAAFVEYLCDNLWLLIDAENGKKALYQNMLVQMCSFY